MNENIKHKKFREVNLDDEFFDSLKKDYPTFDNWFISHLESDAFVLYDEQGKIQGFLHLKEEKDIVDDVRPVIQADKILKVATFKVDAHGTKMGEQFIKIIMDYAVNEDMDLCYVTIFPKHKKLIELVQAFGFEEYGEKGSVLYPEKVFVKNMHKMTENRNIITDISHTNSIHKIYVCTMGVDILKYGDIIVLYRTAEQGRSAEYSAVATSICIVEEIRPQSEFKSFNEFFVYANQYSVFDRNDLRYWYNRGGCKAIKMTYNAAMEKRIVRHDLIEKIGMDREAYWGFMQITDRQFDDIIEESKVNKNIFK